MDRGPGWREAAPVALVAFLAFRVVTELVGFVASSRNPAAPPGGRGPVGMWRQWDVNWMIDLAARGYQALGHVVGADGSVRDGTAFPPAIPLLLRSATAVGIPADLAAIAWSGLFLLLALAMLYRLAAMDCEGRVAAWTLVLLLVYPFSLFFGTGYAESLALLGTVAAFLYARRRVWLVAGIAVAVALLAKVVFILLLLPLTVEWLGWDPAAEPRRVRRTVFGLAALWLPPLAALGAWMAYLGRTFGDPLRFLAAQKLWGRALGLPAQQVGMIFDAHVNAGIRAINALDLAALLLLLVMAIYAFRHLRASYGVLLGAFFVVFAFNTSLESNGRHLSVLFPVFLGLARWTEGRTWVRVLLVVVQLPLAALLVGRFATGHWAG